MGKDERADDKVGEPQVSYFCLDYVFLMNNKFKREMEPQLKAYLSMPRYFPSEAGLVCPGEHHASDHFSLVYEL